ncbi:MAG: hypothetical protein GXZ05_12980 [Gammaproteobacteria bacterium]|jgi:hypothetical protein|nr:hypothetical protein [Gammaproteobacteria bacterium]
MSAFRNSVFTACLLCAAAGHAEGLADYSGEWIEQADDPLKISLQPIDDERLEARIRHGHSDEVRRLVLSNRNSQLIDESGAPRFVLEHGKLRQLDTSMLVLFVKLQ